MCVVKRAAGESWAARLIALGRFRSSQAQAKPQAILAVEARATLRFERWAQLRLVLQRIRSCESLGGPLLVHGAGGMRQSIEVL